MHTEVWMQLLKEKYARKRIYNGCLMQMENSLRITVRYHSASLMMPKSYSCDGIFNPHLITITDSYNLWPILYDMSHLMRKPVFAIWKQ